MAARHGNLMALALFVGLPLGLWASDAPEKPAKPEITHTQAKVVVLRGKHGANKLQTLAVSPSGQIVALLGLPRYGTDAKGIPSEVQILGPDGEKLNTIKLGFAAQSINCDPKGNILVAGSGKLAEYSPTGSLLREVDLPHLATLLGQKDELKKRAEEQLKAEAESYKQMTAQYQKTVDRLKAKDKEKLTASEKAQLRAAELNLKAFEQMQKQTASRTVDQVVEELTARLRGVNGVAATERDIFIATGEAKGYGYAIWRMNRDCTEPKSVLTGIGGCCGQMDVQASGDKLYVAENTRHKVGIYDRDGKRLGSFGKRGRDGDAECFGSCCNPMNTRICADGSVLTAESEGHVKRFAADGTYLGPVGSAKLAGGCKNVALGASPDGEMVYFCDQPGSRIIFLARKVETSGKNK